MVETRKLRPGHRVCTECALFIRHFLAEKAGKDAPSPKASEERGQILGSPAHVCSGVVDSMLHASIKVGPER